MSQPRHLSPRLVQDDFFSQAEDGIRYGHVTGVQTCALPISVGIELELIGMGPDIRRIMCHEDRNVADNTDAAAVAVRFQIEPLFEEEKLIELLRFDLVMKLLASASQSRGCAPNQRSFPFEPCGAMMRGLQRAEQRIVIKPRSE